MEFTKLKPKESASIISALEGGVVPQRGIQHLLVGRSREVDEIVKALNGVSEGRSTMKVWVGDFGSGKSFMLRTIESLALQKNFVVSTADFTPTRRLHASDGKARAMYSEIINRIVIQNDQDGNAIDTILEQWIQKIMEEVVHDEQIDLDELLKSEHWQKVTYRIIDTTRRFKASSLAYELGQAIAKYFEGYASQNIALQESALHWIKGEYTTKTEAHTDLGVRQIITDDNYYNALKALAELFLALGYQGFVINLDEAVNLYKLPMTQTRSNNYEVILNMYNECVGNSAAGLFINIGATRKTVEDERRGFFSYGALKRRLEVDNVLDRALVNTANSVIYLKPLSQEDIFTLLSKLKSVFEQHYAVTIACTSEHIRRYMEEQLNRPGAAEFLTPSTVIRDFLMVLNLARQNPDTTLDAILDIKYGGATSAVEKDANDHDDDEIEVL